MIASPTRRALLGGAALLVASPAFLKAQTRTLNLYSSRHYDTDEALYSDFTKQTGIAMGFNFDDSQLAEQRGDSTR